MTTTLENSVTIPLPEIAHQQAQRNARLQTDPTLTQMTYLNTLAVYALHSYLSSIGINSCLETSRAWSNYLPTPFLYSDLDLPALGTLICCPILPYEDYGNLQLELLPDSFAYVAIRFYEVLDRVEIVGYRPILNPADPPEVLDTDFQKNIVRDDEDGLFPTSQFLDYLFDIEDLKKYYDQDKNAVFEAIFHRLESQYSSLIQILPQLLYCAQRESKKKQGQDPQKNSFNQYLEILIDQVKQSDADSLSEQEKLLFRRKILSSAMGEIQKSGKFWKNTEGKYADAYNQTLLKILEFFYRNYQRYDPTKGATVITWLSHRFDWEFRDQQKKVWKVQNKERSNHISIEDESLELIDMMKDRSKMLSDGYSADLMKEEIKNWINTHPQLQQIYIEKRSSITARKLLQKRFLEEASWRELSEEFSKPLPTLSRFYERQCRPRLIAFFEKNYDFDSDKSIKPPRK